MVLRQIHIIFPGAARAGGGGSFMIIDWTLTLLGKKWNKKKQVLRKEMLTWTKNELSLNKDPCAQKFQTQHLSIWQRPKKTRGSSALTEPWSLMQASQVALMIKNSPPNAGGMRLGFDPLPSRVQVPLSPISVVIKKILPSTPVFCFPPLWIQTSSSFSAKWIRQGSRLGSSGSGWVSLRREPCREHAGGSWRQPGEGKRSLQHHLFPRPRLPEHSYTLLPPSLCGVHTALELTRWCLRLPT